ncbi:MAG: CYTH domain-containing protein [Candidatus Micrarchaeota archaeon]
MDIEVEIRSFITREKYEELIKFFTANGEFVNEDYQETFYFDSPVDLRIQRNNFYSKIWMKRGNLHDEQREEIEVKFAKEDFEKLEKLFTSTGLNVKIKWFRKRHTFNWQGISVMVDYTKGYGYILELEKMSTDAEKQQTLEMLKQKLRELNIEQTPREEFEKAYKNYEQNWKTLVN